MAVDKPSVTPLVAALVTDPIRPRCTVEIETMARGGIPKVTVRVDDDDPETAKHLAVETYLDTIQRLLDGDEDDETE